MSSSRDRKIKAAMHERLQRLRAITNSSAVNITEIHLFFLNLFRFNSMDISLLLPNFLQHIDAYFFCLTCVFPQMNKASIIVDASKYINELKQKVVALNQEIGTSRISIDENQLPAVQINTY